MGLDRPDAEHELVGDLGVRVAEGEEPEDLDLARGQIIGEDRRRRRLRRSEGGTRSTFSCDISRAVSRDTGGGSLSPTTPAG